MADSPPSGVGLEHSKRARWVHQIGYVTTAIVALGCVALGWAVVDDRARRNNPRFYSGTVEHELKEEGERWVRGSAIRSLAFVPAAKALSGDGIRLAVMPSFSDWYAVALSTRSGSERASGAIVRLQQPTFDSENDKASPIKISRTSFAIPLNEYREFAAWLDHHVDGYDGDGYMCLDGTPVAFERIVGTRTVSGVGNCEVHYDEIRMRSLAFLKRYLPVNTLPAEADWHDQKE